MNVAVATNMFLNFLHPLIDLTVFSLDWANRLVSPLRISKTGYANPRVRNTVGVWGYSSHAYHLSISNIHKWLKDQSELFPMVLQVQTINRCNGACPICPYSYTIHLQTREVMDDALFTKIVDECAAEADLHDFVPMSKNEPLMDRKLEQHVAEFKAKAQPHQMVELVTNGTALIPSRARRLVDAGVDLITISINASNEATYREVRRGLSWKRVMSNLEALTNADLAQVNIYLRFVRERRNSRDLKVFRQRWKRFNLFMFDVNNRAGAVRDYDEMMIAPQNELAARLKRIAGRRVYPVCPYVFSMAHILQNGDMPMCSNDWLNREILGNVKTQTIREIYNSPRMNEVRELMRQGRFEEIEPCRACSFYHEWMKSPLKK